MTGISEAILDCDALTLSDRIKRRNVSCREVMIATLARIGRLNPDVNAVVSMMDEETLLAEADKKDELLQKGLHQGWMHGFPQAVKDISPVEGLIMTSGSPIFANRRSTKDAPFVRRLRDNGAIFIGKTNTSEFSLGSQTFNPVFGATGNAYAPDLTSGGSSGGAAVATALAFLPVADGSDAMGSLRNPAAYNNIYGFRPSFGRIPNSAQTDVFFRQLGTVGPMARSVADLAMMLSVMAGPSRNFPLSLDDSPALFAQKLDCDVSARRIGWLGDLNGRLAMEDGVLGLCREGLSRFEALGCKVDDVRINFPIELVWQCWLALRSFLVSGELAGLYRDPERRAQLKPEVIYEIEQGLALSGMEIHAASEMRSAWFLHLVRLFEKYDALVLPSAQLFPFPKDIRWPQQIAGRPMDTYHRWMETAIFSSLAGIPAINLPAGFNANGLPMGMQLIGRPKGDFALLQLAHAYDVETRWPFLRPPPMIANR